MKLIENYNAALKALYDHVGFTPDWVEYPIEDETDKFWGINDGEVKYADSEEAYRDEDSKDYYTDDIYTQRFYEKHVYEGADFTMIFCDPHVDGMIWFRIFDNTKRIN